MGDLPGLHRRTCRSAVNLRQAGPSHLRVNARSRADRTRSSFCLPTDIQRKSSRPFCGRPCISLWAFCCAPTFEWVCPSSYLSARQVRKSTARLWCRSHTGILPLFPHQIHRRPVWTSIQSRRLPTRSQSLSLIVDAVDKKVAQVAAALQPDDPQILIKLVQRGLAGNFQVQPVVGGPNTLNQQVKYLLLLSRPRGIRFDCACTRGTRLQMTSHSPASVFLATELAASPCCPSRRHCSLLCSPRLCREQEPVRSLPILRRPLRQSSWFPSGRRSRVRTFPLLWRGAQRRRRASWRGRGSCIRKRLPTDMT